MKKLLLLIFIFLPSICKADTITGLVGWWKLDETSGNAVDSISTNTGTPTGTTAGVSCKINNCRSFNGSSDFINISNTVPFQFGTGDFTVSAWMNVSILNNPNTDAEQDEITYYLNTTNQGWVLGVTATGIARFLVRQSVGNQTDISSSASLISINSWYHFVAIRNGGNTYIYINNIQVASGSGTVWDIGTSGQLNFGKLLNTGTVQRWFKGNLDDVRIYNRALTASDVAQLYNQGFYGNLINNALVNNVVVN